MAESSTFQPQGSTFFVGTVAVNCAPSGANTGAVSYSYRIRNLSNLNQYFTYGANSSIASAGAPGAGTPVANTVGMSPNVTETFRISGVWFIASSSVGFEVTAGEGV